MTSPARSGRILRSASWLTGALAAATFVAWGIGGPASAAEGAFVIPAPKVDQASTGKTETAVIAGGCFWGVQGVFQHVKGVTNAVSGYSGGGASTAHYNVVGTGETGHAESVAVTFNPKEISYGQILQIYFSVAHDPTELNRQGPDTGTQYRSAIFFEGADQKKVAEAYVAQLGAAGAYPDKIVTEISPLKGFYPAEAYHQDFLTLNPDYPYIVYNDLPKIENLKRLFPALYRDKPVLVSAANG
ncbi:peptide-methionine (S)-S-oxide reductase MsrA [Mesorhizobium sp. BR1-1-16]|uniref:peptide-methionine (S)-S-oxide reductase MsrA n=1 Tax=Mesorhizobium sp. BR1-1-16 TaxID=2876653 RepID=UPI001CCE1E04|nr:peptide-methionine (S)-S-oxide reductase MsrA [Mesorhizobium sp. BR1-1-16]MBZ9938848.1 peptide-methionine (S)-S-oxide reductase MsrA [Mesorhizobium sp. BR1-1-16]